MAPATSKANLKLAVDAEEDWSGWANSKLRRKVQNRLNQRATRQRKALEKEQAQQRSASKPGPSGLRPLRPKLVDHDGENSQRTETSQAVMPYTRVPSPRGNDNLRDLHPLFEDYQARKLFHTGTIHDDQIECKQHKLKTPALVIWPMMGQILMPNREPIENVLFRLTMDDDLRLDATIYSQWTLMFSQRTTETRTPLLALNRVLKRVREAIATGSITETILFCILVLCGKPLEQTTLNELGHGLFQPPAPQAGGLHYIGTIECHSEHINILRRLVQDRGGLSAIRTPSLPEHLQYIDLLDATQRVIPPAFDFCFTNRYILETEMAVYRLPLSHADAFPVDDQFKEIIVDLRRYCVVLDELCSDPLNIDYMALPYRMLPTYREIIHHRLLSRPRHQPASEITRLAILVFSYGVTLPLPNMQPIQGLTRQLREAFDAPEYTESQGSGLLFWAAMLGAIASFNSAAEDDLHLYFVGRLRTLALELVIDSWETARGLLASFVWLSRACDDGARYVWENLFADLPYAGVLARFPQLSV